MKISTCLSLFAGLILLNSSCSNSRSQKRAEIPACIASMIEKFKAEPKQNPPRSVTEYQWNGKAVYYVTSPCCDQYNSLFSAECTYLGAPDGGLTGKGDGKVPGFKTEATNAKLVWKDNR